MKDSAIVPGPALLMIISQAVIHSGMLSTKPLMVTCSYSYVHFPFMPLQCFAFIREPPSKSSSSLGSTTANDMMLPCCMPVRVQARGVSQLTAAELLCIDYLHASWIRFGFQAFDEAFVTATDGHNLAGWAYLLYQSLHNLLNCSHTLSATCGAKQPLAKHVYT